MTSSGFSLTFLIMPITTLFFFVGCQYLEETRIEPTEVSWSGYLTHYEPKTGDSVYASEATLDMVDLNDTLLITAGQPLSGNPAYYRFENIPVQTPIALRLSGNDLTTMVWQGTTPSGTGMWLTGSIFTYHSQLHDEFLANVADIKSISIESLKEGEVAHLWGEPLNPQEWSNVEITATDGDNHSVEVHRFYYDEDGNLAPATDGPVDLFLAFNLMPGLVTLSIIPQTGEIIETIYPTRGGDMLSAIFHALGEEQ